MSETKKFEDLSKEQQTALKQAGRGLVTRLFFNGVNAGALIVVSNVILYFVNELYVKSQAFLFVSSVVTDIVLLKMMGRANREVARKFSENAKKILTIK